ncbi:MAG: hypothetical protein GY796_24325 [Chloroflexi bacterium]|nr:hypothetical protein [Chloroflexota bacterium]
MIDQVNNNHQKINNKAKKRPILFQPAKWVFFTLFLFVFVFSGIITMLDVIPYRMGLVTFLIFPLFLIYGLKIDSVFVLYVLLALVIVISAIYNNTPVFQLLLFMRTLIFSYLIYYLVKVYVNKDNITTIIRLAVLVGLIQLPIIIFQFFTYDWLPARITNGMNLSSVDYDFGTFNFKGDYSLTFFLILLIVFLLFDKKRNYIIPHRLFVLVWLTITVLIANADIAKGILLTVWGIYFVTHLNRKIGMYLLILLALVLGVLLASGLWYKIGADVTRKVDKETQSILNGNGVEVYLSGGYARGAAIYYFLNNKLLIVGDGPSKYVDPINKVFLRGNVGHIFTFYSEVGILGWLLSMMIFFQIAFKFTRRKLRLNRVTLIMLFSIFLLSFTSQVMNDVSIVMIYSLVAVTYLIPARRHSHGEQSASP